MGKFGSATSCVVYEQITTTPTEWCKGTDKEDKEEPPEDKQDKDKGGACKLCGGKTGCAVLGSYPKCYTDPTDRKFGSEKSCVVYEQITTTPTEWCKGTDNEYVDAGQLFSNEGADAASCQKNTPLA